MAAERLGLDQLLGTERTRPGSLSRRIQPVRYIGVHSQSSFILESIQFIWKSIVKSQSESPYATILIGLSGGSSPKAVFKTLSSLCSSQTGEFCIQRPSSERRNAGGNHKVEGAKIDWSKVAIFLIDERYVPSDHPESNQNMIRQTLLSEREVRIPESNLIFPDTSKPIEDCVSEYELKLYNILAKTGRPHLVTLGMGDDGHLASWFPPLSINEYIAATSGGRLVHHQQQDRFAVHDRITVSLNLICSSREKVFLLSGDSKVLKWKQLISLNMDKHFQQEPVLQVINSRHVTVVSRPPIIQDVVSTVYERESSSHLSVIVFGASGDLAKKKIIPVLFSLFCEGRLPTRFHIFGYARSDMVGDKFFESVKPYLLKLDSFYRGCDDFNQAIMKDSTFGFLDKFKKCLSYIKGSYDKPEDFKNLARKLEEVEFACTDRIKNDRLFYLAVPPDVFGVAVETARACCWSANGWNRFIVEKPFGRDYNSAMKLASTLLKVLKEEETFRIDHYLGKEMVLNLMAIRFANVAFSPLMCWQYVNAVRVTFKEDIGVEGRGGYFDQYGIIRDIMQNHLLQILTIVAMERPASLYDDDVRDEKVKVLKQIPPINLSDVVIGQYTKSLDGKHEGYLDDKTIPAGSRCPTFSTAVMYISNERWSGVPFILKAGKGLEKREAEIRIQFRSVPGNLFGDVPQNELVVKIQPSEAIYMKVLTKKPGLATGLEQTELDLTVMDRFDIDRLPDAYERLILDVIKGDKQNFVRTDELREAWRIFTPLLHELEEKKVQPILYPFGSNGPEEAYDLIKRVGFHRYEGYSWNSI